MASSEGGALEPVRYLLSLGADVNIKSGTDATGAAPEDAGLGSNVVGSLLFKNLRHVHESLHWHRNARGGKKLSSSSSVPRRASGRPPGLRRRAKLVGTCRFSKEAKDGASFRHMAASTPAAMMG